MDISALWKEYGMEELNDKLTQFFPAMEWNTKELFEQIVSGDVFGALTSFVKGVFAGIGEQAAGFGSIIMWLLILGIISALLARFGDIFENHQISDLSSHFIYLLLISVLFQGYMELAGITKELIENILLFMKIFIPTYMIAVGAAGGSATAYGYYQVLMLLLYGVEKAISVVILPLIHLYIFLVFFNGLWGEDRLVLFMDLVKKGISYGVKLAFGVLTGISLFQSMLLPAVDSLKNTTLQKAVGAIPGIGDAADGIAQIVLGSAVLIKNSIGIILLLFLLVLCSFPLIKIALLSWIFKGCAAVMGLTGEKKVCECTDRVGEGGLLLLKTAATVMTLFMVAVALAAYTTS